MYIQGHDILVLGAGISGIAAAKLAAAQGAMVTLFDSNPKALSPEKLTELQSCGIRFISGTPDTLDGTWHTAIFSPGIPKESPLGKKAAAISQNCTSELAFGSSFLNCPILAVTGTNGKTTTVEMLTHCIAATGRKTLSGGNIGLPLSQIALDHQVLDAVVAEVSSFQLEFPDEFRPYAAALLNITPDHLSRHGTMEAYRNIKFSIFNTIANNRRCVLTSPLASARPNSLTVSTEPEDNAAFGPSLVSGHPLPFNGRHNLENALTAIALASTLDISADECLQALSSFRPGHHRIETVASAAGIEFIDDSKATNVDAVIQAINTLKTRHRPIALIAGGVDKGCSLEELIPLLRPNITGAHLIGDCAQRLKNAWSSQIPCREYTTLQEAVSGAAASLPSCGIVLLSPACASQDMFKDYAERGDLFKQAALQWIADRI